MQIIKPIVMLCMLGTVGACSKKSDSTEAAATSGGESLEQSTKQAGNKAKAAGDQAKAAGDKANDAAHKANDAAHDANDAAHEISGK